MFYCNKLRNIKTWSNSRNLVFNKNYFNKKNRSKVFFYKIKKLMKTLTLNNNKTKALLKKINN
jgi:hypothetical protein